MSTTKLKPCLCPVCKRAPRQHDNTFMGYIELSCNAENTHVLVVYGKDAREATLRWNRLGGPK